MPFSNIIFKNKLSTYRFFGYFTGIALPLFGYIHMLSGDETDPIFFRFVLGCLCVGLTALSHFNDWFRLNFEKVVLFMGYTVITWFCYVLYLQNFSMNYLFGFYIILTAPSYIVETERQLIAFLVYSIGVFALFAYFAGATFVPKAMLVATSSTFAFIIYLFRISSIRLQTEIEIKNESLTKINEELNEKSKSLEAQRLQITAQNQELESVNQELNQKNINITDSIEYAKNIQTAMLPGRMTLNEVANDSFVFFQPRDIVSGDFYWVAKQGDLNMYAVADCTGHGVPGAFMSIVGMSLLNNIIFNDDVVEPNLILDKLRVRLIERLANQGGNSNKDGMDVAIVVYDSKKGILKFSGAFHSLYIVKNDCIEEVRGCSMPIGEYRKVSNFKVTEIPVQKGDRFYMLSDGFLDQFGGEDRKKFTKRKWLEVLLDIQSKSMTEQGLVIGQIVNNWKGDYEQIDDMTVMGIEL